MCFNVLSEVFSNCSLSVSDWVIDFLQPEGAPPQARVNDTRIKWSSQHTIITTYNQTVKLNPLQTRTQSRNVSKVMQCMSNCLCGERYFMTFGYDSLIFQRQGVQNTLCLSLNQIGELMYSSFQIKPLLSRDNFSLSFSHCLSNGMRVSPHSNYNSLNRLFITNIPPETFYIN